MANHNLPSGAGKVADAHPEVWQAFAALGKACAEAGPLDARTRRLVKLALAVGGGSEEPCIRICAVPSKRASSQKRSSRWPCWRFLPWACRPGWRR